MSDKFHQALDSIINILKKSPISITIENVQRLANIYKFETFTESIDEELTRLSIAGKILVIDIDYTTDRVVKQGINSMTFFTVKDIKLILANNYNGFDYFYKNENILKWSLTKFSNLNKFNEILSKLTIFDQFSDEKLNLFEYYMVLFESLKNKNALFDVQLNYDYDFDISVGGFVTIGLVMDDRVSLNYKVNDIGLQLSFLNGKIVVPKNYLIEHKAVYNELKNEDNIITELVKFKTNDNNSELFVNDDKNLTLTILKFFTKELVVVDSVLLNDSPFELITKIINFNKLISSLNNLIETKFEVVNKYEKLNSIEFNSQLFKEFENGTDVNKQDNYLTVSMTEEYFKVKSNLEQFNETLKFDDAQFSSKIESLDNSLKSILQ